VNTLHAKLDILNLAIEALNSNAGLLAKVQQSKVLPGISKERTPDAEVRLCESGDRFLVQIKHHAQHTNLGSLIDQIKRLPNSIPGLLAADYINPSMAEKLKQADIQFIDTAGNAYINRQPVYVFITQGKNNSKSTRTLPTAKPVGHLSLKGF